MGEHDTKHEIELQVKTWVINMASSKAIAISVLLLRMITFSSLVACVALIVTNKFKYNGQKELFSDILVYRYILATALIGLAYTLLQIPLSIYHVCTEKRFIRGDILVTSDFYADKVVGFFLATGVGAGFAVGIESKRIYQEMYVSFVSFGATNVDEWRSKFLTFFDRGNIATAALFLGFLSMALISVFSSINLSTRSSGRQSFFF